MASLASSNGTVQQVCYFYQAPSRPHTLGMSLTNPETVLSGDDRRQRVSAQDSLASPYHNLVHLLVHFPPCPKTRGHWKQPGTAFLTNQEVLFHNVRYVIALTAAHVLCPEAPGYALLSRRPQDLATRIDVEVAVNGDHRPNQPFHLYRFGAPSHACSANGWYEVSPNWYNDGRPESATTVWSEDFGALFLKKSLLPPQCTGFLIPDGVSNEILSGKSLISCAGYPKDKDKQTMWQSEGQLTAFSPVSHFQSIGSTTSTASSFQAFHDADTESGQSGSPIYSGTGPYTVAAIHHKGPPRPSRPGEVVVAHNEAIVVSSSLMNVIKKFHPPQGFLDAVSGVGTCTAPCDQDMSDEDGDSTDHMDSQVDAPVQDNDDLYSATPAACQQDTGVSAANPVVASSFQHGQPPDTHVDAVAAIPIAPLGSEAGGFSDESTESADIQLPIDITRHPAPELLVQPHENIRVSCDARSGSGSDLLYQWYKVEQRPGGSCQRRIDTGQVLRLPKVQHSCTVFCIVSDDSGYQATSELCRVTVRTTASSTYSRLSDQHTANVHIDEQDGCPLSIDEGQPQVDGVERNLRANVDHVFVQGAAVDTPWSSRGLNNEISRASGMDAGVVCSRLQRQRFLSEADVREILECTLIDDRNQLLFAKLRCGGWPSLEALCEALALTSQRDLALQLQSSTKDLPGYRAFALPQVGGQASQAAQQLTEETIDECRERLTPLHIRAITKCLYTPDMLSQFILAAGVGERDLANGCPRNPSEVHPTYTSRALEFLAQQKGMTVRKALRVADNIGCQLSVREELLKISDPMADD